MLNAGDMVKVDLPAFEDGDIVTAVMCDGKAVECCATAHELVKCPMCGSSHGYRVKDGKSLWWACVSEECIKRNANQGLVFSSKSASSDLSACNVPARYFDADLRHSKQSKDKVATLTRFCEKNSEVLLLTGNPGTGKTFHAAALCRKLISSRHRGRFYTCSELYLMHLEAMKTSAFKLSAELCELEFLVLDDLNARSITSGVIDFMHHIIDSRYKNLKSTIVTTNFAPDSLAKHFGDPISRRLLSGVKVLIV